MKIFFCTFKGNVKIKKLAGKFWGTPQTLNALNSAWCYVVY